MKQAAGSRRSGDTRREALSTAEWLTDSSGVIRHANAAASELLGGSSDDLVGAPVRSFIPRNEIPVLSCALQRLFADAEAQSWRVRFQSRDGRVRAPLIRLSLLAHRPGEPPEVAWQVLDEPARAERLKRRA